MRTSLSLGTRGKLSKNVKRALIIASFGFIALSIPKVIRNGGLSSSYEYESKYEETHQDRVKKRIKTDDIELIMILKIMLKYI
jgi:hypothetical protein